MQRAEDFQTPVVTPNVQQEAEYQDEWTPRVGILVGGFPNLQWNGIGEESMGHHLITRRVWLSFVRLRVGQRNEFDGALEMPANAVTKDWSKNEARLKWKSPRACAGDVLAMFRSQGFCVPQVLIGHSDPQGLVEKVWPREIRDNYRLFQQIQYFETYTPKTEGGTTEAERARDEEVRLVGDLLPACYASREYVSEYVRRLKDEISAEKGLTNVNDSLKELFYEINEPLPEQKTALVAQAMGKEIVKATQPDGRKDDAIVGVLTSLKDSLDKTNLRLDKFEERFDRESLVEGESPTGSEATSDTETVGITQTSHTSTRTRADGQADRRYK